jgi:hypothetical protein
MQVKLANNTYRLFDNGHRWELDQCKQCGTIRTNIFTGNRPQGSKDGFKTIDTKAGNCFKRL